MMNAITTTRTNELAQRARANIGAIMAGKSKATRAAWNTTWSLYGAWCERVAVEPRHIDAAQALAFLMAHPAAYTTQAARLSHLRSIVALMAETEGDHDLRARAALLKLLKLPNPDDQPGMYRNAQPAKQPNRKARRSGHAATAHEVYQQLASEAHTLAQTARNRAVVALGYYGGLRRSEIVKLLWSDVDFGEGTIAIRGAKKRKPNQVDYVPLRDELRKALQDWRQYSTPGAAQVITRVSQKGVALDKPITGETVRAIFGDLAMPHDARRTLATRALEAGTPVNQVQALLRHASPDTTLKYAQYVDAKALKRVKLGY